ncbi:MAG: serine hydrolase domain-containing protein [Steroidobacteraceae bacterium]
MTLALPAWSSTDNLDARLTRAKAAIDQALAGSSMPGLVIGITDRHELRTVIVHGYSDLKARTPLTPSSRFAIGSVSKAFTAIALMQLAQENRFDPHAPISRYLPSFKVPSRFAPITGHDLMSHTSGLPNYLPDSASSRYAAIALHDFEPSYAPGAHWWYSNTGYQLLGYVLENIEHDRYTRVLQRRVLDPLGMSSTSAVIDDAERARMVVSYSRWSYDGTYVEAPWFEYSAGDGSLVANVADMSAYMRFYLNHGMGDKGRVLSESTFATLTTPVLEDYAYGVWVRQDKKGHKVIEHTGSIFGFHSAVQAHMDEGFGIVFLSSSSIDQELQKWVVQVVAAAFDGTDLPAAPGKKVNSEKADLEQCAGQFRLVRQHGSGTDGTASTGAPLEFVFAGNRLFLKSEHGNIPLEKMGPDLFRASGEATDGLPFVFGRSGADEHIEVTDVSHGALWYAAEKFRQPMEAAAPKEYAAYVGHFVNAGPEGPVARVFVRNGRLMMLLSEDEDAKAEPLEPVGAAVFRIGKAAYSPERAHFDTLVGGQALRLLVSGVPLYRKDTP